MAAWNAVPEDTVPKDVAEAEPDLLTEQWSVKIMHQHEWDKNTFLMFLEEIQVIAPGSVEIQNVEEIDGRLYGLECSQIAPLSPSTVKIEPLDLSQWAAQGSCDILVAEEKNTADQLRCLTKKGKRHCELAVNSCSVGAFLDPFHFSCHGVIKSDEKSQGCTRICAKFDFLKDALYLEINVGSFGHRMEYSFSMLKKDYFVTRDYSTQTTSIWFYYDIPPKIWKQGKRQNMNQESDPETKSWDRDTGIPGLCDTYSGFCSVLKIEIGEESYTEFEDWKAKMELGRFKLWWGPVRTVESGTGQRLLKHILDDRGSTWSMKCLFSLGYKVTDRVSEIDVNTLRSYEKQNPRNFAKAVQKLVYSKLVKRPVVNLMVAFLEIWSSLVDEGHTEEVFQDPTSSGDIAAVRHVLVTPAAIFYLPPEQCEMNRVVRHFKPENFAKVSFCDEDENKLCAMSPRCLQKPVKRIKRILQRGIFSDSRHFVYLGSSNSQLRQHSCWFYASTKRKSVFDIRKWMGNLSGIRCVALYVARLGQFFSTSQPTVTLSPSVVQEIDDITTVNPKGTTYCFTDGVGKISVKLAAEVAKKMKLDYVPSAYQIRMAGIKGVLAIDPTLGDRRLVQVRPSMKKFPSNQYGLEVTQTSKPNILHLNRQVVSLLSGAGIRDEVFLELEEDYLLELAGMFLSETQAAKYLSECRLGFSIQDLRKTGYQILLDPYFRSLLTAKYKECLWELREKARVPISPDKGRLMMGVVDETGTLQYGQVFVQYSTNLVCPQKKTTVLTGHVVITKNPCFHPGDLRKFQAVDCPKLHHMVDVVVFPSVGPRPHPNEISGSDLDGDMYWVCWHDKLIPVRNNCVPMEFPQSARNLLHRDPREEDVIDYIGEYIKHDHLGLIANAHVVFADREGVASEKCIQLARLHSDAVDFPKTGAYPRMDTDLKPKRYPDFMAKDRVLTYHSKGVLGKLFRLCHVLPRFDENNDQEIKTSCLELENLGSKTSQESQQLLHTETEEAYTDYASEMEQLLSAYGLNNETELLTGTARMFQWKGVQRKASYERMKVARRQLHQLQQRMRFAFNQHTCSEIQRRDKARVWAEIAKTKEFQSFAWLPGAISMEPQKYIPRQMIEISFLKSNDILWNVVENFAQSMTICPQMRQEERLHEIELLQILETYLQKSMTAEFHLVPVHWTGINLLSDLTTVLPITAYLEISVGGEQAFHTDMELLQHCKHTLSNQDADQQDSNMPHITQVTLIGSTLHVECTPNASRSHSMETVDRMIRTVTENIDNGCTPDSARVHSRQEVVLTTSGKVLDLTRQLSNLFTRQPFAKKTAEILAEWADVEKLLVNNPAFDVLDVLALLLPLVEGENTTPVRRGRVDWLAQKPPCTEQRINAPNVNAEKIAPPAFEKTQFQTSTPVSAPDVTQYAPEQGVGGMTDTGGSTYDLALKGTGTCQVNHTGINGPCEDLAVHSAGLLISFFMLYSKQKNLEEAHYKAKEEKSRCVPSRPETILGHYTPAAVSVLHMSVMRSCTLLLTSQSVQRILKADISNLRGLERRLYSLSEETHEQHLRRFIERRTECSIYIHKDIYKEIPIFTLEAVGNRSSQDELDRELRQLERISLTRPDQNARNVYAPKSFLGLFEGSASQEDTVYLNKYDGPCYNRKRYSEHLLKVPVLSMRSENQASNALFERMWRKQMDIIRDSYDPDYLGDLRIIARFGRSFYKVQGPNPRRISIEELNRACNNDSIYQPQNKTYADQTSCIERGSNIQRANNTCPRYTIYSRSGTQPRMDRPYRFRGQARHMTSLEPSEINYSYQGRDQVHHTRSRTPSGRNLTSRGGGQLRDVGNVQPPGMDFTYRGRGQFPQTGSFEPSGRYSQYRGEGQLPTDMRNLEPSGMELPHRGRGRVKGGSQASRTDWHGQFGMNQRLPDSQEHAEIRPMFFPESISRDQIQLFIDREGFEEYDRESQVVCTPSHGEGDHILNEDLEYVKFRAKAQKWCSVIIHTQKPSASRGRAAYDVRFQVQSLQNLPEESMAQYKDFTEPKQPILFYNNPLTSPTTSVTLGSADASHRGRRLNLAKNLPKICVHRDYTKKVRFVRQKEIVKYSLRKNDSRHQYNHFTDQVELHVSHVQEYEKPLPDGNFQITQEPKDEVKFVLPSKGFPLLNETDEWDNIGYQLMEMALKFSHSIERR